MFNASMFVCMCVFDDVKNKNGVEHMWAAIWAGKHGCKRQKKKKRKKKNGVWGMGRERRGGKKQSQYTYGNTIVVNLSCKRN